MELKPSNTANNNAKRTSTSFETNKKYIYIVMIFLIILSGFILVNNISNTNEESFLDTESKDFNSNKVKILSIKY